MPPPRPPATRVRKYPHPGDFILLIRRLLAAGKVSYSRHVIEDRLDEREIDVHDIARIINTGIIEGEIKEGKRPGDLKCLVVGRLPDHRRNTGVATVVVKGERLIIVTAEWMD